MAAMQVEKHIVIDKEKASMLANEIGTVITDQIIVKTLLKLKKKRFLYID